MDRTRCPYRCRKLHSVLVLATIGVVSSLPAWLTAEDFRIETKIFAKADEPPVSETVTLFHDGVVYDFLAKPPQIAVFRRPASGKPGRFILLDPQRQVRTELTTDRIESLLVKLRKWASMQPTPALRFAAAPEFDETFENDNGKLVLASHLQSYAVETAPIARPAALADYREFLDWYARLNALMQGGPPPGPRLALNAALAKRQVVPVSVELSKPGQDQPLRATHEFTWLLSRQDHARIDEIRDALMSYAAVSNEEFLARDPAP